MISSTISEQKCSSPVCYSPALKDVWEFLLEGRLFKKWTRDQLLSALVEAFENNSLYWTAANGKITGVTLARIDHSAKTMHIVGIEGSLRPFVDTYRRLFANYRLTGLRKGRLITYSL